MDLITRIYDAFDREEARQKVARENHIKELDRCHKENVENSTDGKIGDVKIQRSNDGWELVRYEAMTSGTPEWKRKTFSRVKADVERAIPRYKN